MKNRVWSLGIDTVAIAFIVLFCGAGLWGLAHDDTAATLHTAIGALRSSPHAILLGTGDLSEYWRPWGTEAARFEEVAGYAYVASMIMSVFLRALFFELLPAMAATAVRLRKTISIELARAGRASMLPLASGRLETVSAPGVVFFG